MNSFETAPDAKKLRIKPILDFGKKVLPIVCPNPNVSITALPPKITIGCR